MKRIWLIITAWLLLLVPTLLIGVGAIRLLRHEQERIAGSAAAAAAERARAVVESIELAVTEVKEGLMENLRRLPAADLAARLEAWKGENPLIRNVFVWEPARGVRLPAPGAPLSEEETAFLRRYDDLFTGRAVWRAPEPEQGAAAEPGPAKLLFSDRRQLRELARQEPSMAAETAAPTDTPPIASGWLPWFSGHRLSLLGWVEAGPGGERYGVEVEMMALLSRLLTTLPAEPPAGETYALLDGSGQVFHQSGPAIIEAATSPLASVSAAPTLPHWSVAVYRSPGGAADGGKGFLLVSSLLVGAFVTAILFGGSLLLWQAYRHLLDARRKTSFVSNVSHELKTPLTTIRMYAELLGEGKIAAEEKRRHYLRVIIAESQRLTRLVNNVLDFSRLEQGKKQYAPEPIDLPEALQAILDTQAMRLEEAGISLLRRIPERRLTVTTDGDALGQVVLNLVDNAVKYAAGGKELIVELSAAAGQCRIRLIDRGPGIPAAHRRRIFDKFHRVDDSLTARQPGSGLGLSIARQLLLDLGGDLRLLPHPEGGACFEITLPCEES